MQKNADHHAIISAKFSSLNDFDEIYVSIVSLYEMEYGAKHAKDTNMANEMRLAIESVKNSFTILNLTEQGAKIFAEIKERYKQETQLGKRAIIKHNADLMIASTAIEIGAILVSNDHNMFKTIQKFQSDFKWEDWTQ
jgi:predicted nucleic acid-binding protein